LQALICDDEGEDQRSFWKISSWRNLSGARDHIRGQQLVGFDKITPTPREYLIFSQIELVHRLPKLILQIWDDKTPSQTTIRVK
jgi:hypothetical protein